MYRSSGYDITKIRKNKNMIFSPNLTIFTHAYNTFRNTRTQEAFREFHSYEPPLWPRSWEFIVWVRAAHSRCQAVRSFSSSSGDDVAVP